LTDTAGLRSQTNDKIEQMGIKMAKEEANNSHGIVFVLDIN
jgi:tRNA U34 5-carboxymethylaminomethyl modifying GTPase MnmE/TrmE